jgi:hypothetical protein
MTCHQPQTALRLHHLLKTFYTGLGGWADQQLSDGTVIWTAPSGQTYRTTPGGSFFFPSLATPTAELIIPPTTGLPSPNRGLMMPTRKRTRAQDRRYRIARERRMNEARLAEEGRKYQAWLAATYVRPTCDNPELSPRHTLRVIAARPPGVRDQVSATAVHRGNAHLLRAHHARRLLCLR